jgi:hypothetical protein
MAWWWQDARIRPGSAGHSRDIDPGLGSRPTQIDLRHFRKIAKPWPLRTASQMQPCLGGPIPEGSTHRPQPHTIEAALTARRPALAPRRRLHPHPGRTRFAGWAAGDLGRRTPRRRRPTGGQAVSGPAHGRGRLRAGRSAGRRAPPVAETERRTAGPARTPTGHSSRKITGRVDAGTTRRLWGKTDREASPPRTGVPPDRCAVNLCSAGHSFGGAVRTPPTPRSPTATHRERECGPVGCPGAPVAPAGAVRPRIPGPAAVCVAAVDAPKGDGDGECRPPHNRETAIRPDGEAGARPRRNARPGRPRCDGVLPRGCKTCRVSDRAVTVNPQRRP